MALAAVLAACGEPQNPFDTGTSPDAALDAGTDITTGIDAPQGADTVTPPDGSDVQAADAVADVPTDAPPACLGGSDAGADASVDPPGTYTYVLEGLIIDATDSPTAGHTGFNIDGLVSNSSEVNGCNHQDFFSLYDGDQHQPAGCAMGMTTDAGLACRGGVDNQLPRLINTFESFAGVDLRAQIAGQIAASRVVLLLRLSNVDDFTNDPSIGVQVFTGYATFNSPCTGVLPDMEYQVAASSLRPGGTSLADAAFNVMGSIEGGRLRVRAGASDIFTLPLPGLATPIVLNIHDLQIRVDVTSRTGRRGNLGGYVPGGEMRAELVRIIPALRATIENEIGAAVDLPVGSLCYDPSTRPPTYGNVGLGMGFSLVRARLAPVCTITDRPAPGVCGSPMMTTM